MTNLHDDEGFTLIELLISIALVSVITAAISAGYLVFLQNGKYNSERDDHSGSAIVAASYLERDAASASTVSATSTTTCSSSTNTLLFSWNEYTASPSNPSPAPGSGTYYAAYAVSVDADSVPAGGGTRYKLERVYCPATGGTERSTIARNLTAASAFSATVGATGTCPNGQTVTAVLTSYGTDTSDPFSYSGCVKGRQR
jgi:prepilin-type N-terminal cleavage/methylation domain-containing protein